MVKTKNNKKQSNSIKNIWQRAFKFLHKQENFVINNKKGELKRIVG